MKKLNPEQCTSALLPIRDALDVVSGKWKLLIRGLCKTMRFVILSLSKNLQDTAKAFKGRSFSYVPQRDRQDDSWVLQSPLLLFPFPEVIIGLHK